MPTTIIEDDEEFEEFEDNADAEGRRLFYFFADWCGPCKSMSERVEDISDEGHSVVKIDVEGAQETARRYNVRALPTLIVLDGTDSVETFSGVTKKKDLIRKLEGEDT